VVEGETGEHAAPADGVRDSTENSKDDVAEGFTHVKTFVREFPHAVDGVSVVWLSNTFLIGHLEMVVEVVGISVAEIGLHSPSFSYRHDGF